MAHPIPDPVQEPYDPPEAVDDEPVAPFSMAHEEYDVHEVDVLLADALGGDRA